ncbi:hypothetical protein EVG20_g8273 [Dentipellis fragilis]|uniref:Uncharacterized protein n=1 Tax=Dentipellis fragilis TaxID=205917 RepID=A0A4Y9Y7T0_9AGAM|nr:hypothetical protein EVG20_g8273 [Dentipellis fragilis]
MAEAAPMAVAWRGSWRKRGGDSDEGGARRLGERAESKSGGCAHAGGSAPRVPPLGASLGLIGTASGAQKRTGLEKFVCAGEVCTQLEAGDKYLDDALDLVEKYQHILSPSQLKEIGSHWKTTARNRPVHPQGIREAVRTARHFEQRAKMTFELAKGFTAAARAAIVFANCVADNVVQLTEKAIAPPGLSDSLRSEIHTAVVNVTLEAAQLYAIEHGDHSLTSSNSIATAVQWANEYMDEHGLTEVNNLSTSGWKDD